MGRQATERLLHTVVATQESFQDAACGQMRLLPVGCQALTAGASRAHRCLYDRLASMILVAEQPDKMNAPAHQGPESELALGFRPMKTSSS